MIMEEDVALEQELINRLKQNRVDTMENLKLGNNKKVDMLLTERHNLFKVYEHFIKAKGKESA